MRKHNTTRHPTKGAVIEATAFAAGLLAVSGARWLAPRVRARWASWRHSDD